MELGALVCTPRNPQCLICPVRQLCVAFQENRAAELPNSGKREAATARRFLAFVIERNGRFLVRQRPAGVVNAHLWEFPNVEVNGGQPRVKEIFKGIFGIAPTEVHRLCTLKHSITRYRITLEAFTVLSQKTSLTGTGGVWKTPAQMGPLAFTSAHRKIFLAWTAGH